MRIPKLVFLVGVSVALFAVEGCATKEQATLTTIPPVGEVSTKGIGEHLLTQGFRITVPGLIVKKSQQLGKYKIRAGTYQLGSENKEGQWFDDAADGAGGKENVLLRSSDKKLCVEKVCASLEFSVGDVYKETTKSSFEQTLLYNGKVGSKVTVSYREFSNGMARAGFTNEASYDLSDSKIIGYKGARLEVLNATNTELTYKVIAGFD